jgi:hypothetical protein
MRKIPQKNKYFTVSKRKICAIEVIGKCNKQVLTNFVVGFPSVYTDLDRNIETDCSNIPAMKKFLIRNNCKYKLKKVNQNKYIYQNPNG